MSRRRSRAKAPIPYEEACEKCKAYSDDWVEPFCPFAMAECRMVYCNSAYTDKCKECASGRYVYEHLNLDQYQREFVR